MSYVYAVWVILNFKKNRKKNIILTHSMSLKKRCTPEEMKRMGDQYGTHNTSSARV